MSASQGLPRLAARLALSLAVLLAPSPSEAKSPVCGDGKIEGVEVCDDANTVADDECSFPSCLPRVCGDNLVNPDPGTDEECDDGNTAPLDGCDASCELECGNGTVEGAEECDTSGESATCDADCTAAACGDGNQNEAAGETCDDGNTIDGDGCNADCTSRETMPRDEQRCVNEANKRLAGVARAQNQDDARCLRDAARGATAILACLGQDLEGRVARSQQIAAARIAARCAAPNVPAFAFSDATTVSDAAPAAVLASLGTVFGADPALANRKLDGAGAACQAEVLRQHNALLEGWLAAANRAKKSALKGGRRGDPAPVDGPTALATRIETGTAGDPRLARIRSRAERRIARPCNGLALDPLFDCGGGLAAVGNLAACAATSAFDAACQALEEADALELGCPSDP